MGLFVSAALTSSVVAQMFEIRFSFECGALELISLRMMIHLNVKGV